MFGLRRFRFARRSAIERPMYEGSCASRDAAHSAVLEAEAELKRLRARVAETQKAVMSLLAQIEDREPDPGCRAEPSGPREHWQDCSGLASTSLFSHAITRRTLLVTTNRKPQP
jgi:hypothetical protein